MYYNSNSHKLANNKIMKTKQLKELSQNSFFSIEYFDYQILKDNGETFDCRNLVTNQVEELNKNLYVQVLPF